MFAKQSCAILANVRRYGSARRRVRVHQRGDARLDGFLDLITEAARARPLDETLAVLARQIAQLVAAPVCSIYLRDGEAGKLILRANVGFPAGAVGRVRLAQGEGITGFAVECLRPVSVAAAGRDPRNKPVPGIGEEQYPVFLAVPLLGDGRAEGALVVQRAERTFAPAEVTLVAALAMPIVHAVSLAATRASALEEHTGPVRLVGEPGAAGLRIGTIAFARGGLPGSRGPDDKAGRQAASPAIAEPGATRHAHAEAAAALAPLARRFPEVAAVLDDARVLERALELVAGGCGAARALDRVAREATRAAALSGDPLLKRRALDLEGLCDRAAARALGQTPPAWSSGTVLVTHRLSSWDALELAAAGGIGVALAAPAHDSPGLALAGPLGLAACAGLNALFRWARAGSRILVDGEAGAVVINPARSDVAGYRLRTRSRA